MTPAFTRSTENMVPTCGDLEDVWVCALSGCLQLGKAGSSEWSVCLMEPQDNVLMYIVSANQCC
ncbi:hypothetical protein BDR07DRAFT_1424563 [Suillus spraguei]|nr:hypothetical protein BDR07DRAFT_1436342 [Suillus spraguei]KAG2355957.1 hypothetical protein BDR07DRAFT_1424563 [Suillus spraguei]